MLINLASAYGTSLPLGTLYFYSQLEMREKPPVFEVPILNVRDSLPEGVLGNVLFSTHRLLVRARLCQISSGSPHSS